MNFKTIAGTFNSQNQRQANTTMFATVLEIGASKLSSSQKVFQSVKLTDDTGEQHQVSIYQGNNPILTSQQLGQRLSFNLSPYQGQRGIAYSGFWNSNANVNQQSQQPKTASPPKAQPQTTGSEEYRTRGLQSACKFLSGKTDTSPDELLLLAKRFTNYILTGKTITTFEQDHDIPSENEPDDLPEFPPQE
jgi:hypothetical protein